MGGMFFPLSTNAPIYYYPFATVGLIVVNAALFFATIGLAVDAEHVESVLWLTLEFDEDRATAMADQQLHARELPEKQGKLPQQLAQHQASDQRRKLGSGNPRLVTSRDFSEPQRPILFALSAHSYVRRTSLSVETNSPTDKDVRRTLPATKSTKSFTGKIMT